MSSRFDASIHRAEQLACDVQDMVDEIIRLRAEVEHWKARATTAGSEADLQRARSELARLGGSAGGKARAASLSPAQRSAQARKAVETRWAKHRAAR
jgi:FtsZ-binding cell division protein ZapB